jgi:hypothetical protein
MDMSLTQAAAFAGTFAGPKVGGKPDAIVICTQITDSIELGPYYLDGRITDGTISGDSVAFHAVSVGASWSFTGTISGDSSMSGNLSIDIAVCGRITDTTIVSSDTLLITGQLSATHTGS